MFIKKFYGYIEGKYNSIQKGALDFYNPQKHKSRNYRHWITHITPNTCEECLLLNEKIFSNTETPKDEPPLHFNCHCEIQPMEAVSAGEATKDGKSGADWWIMNYATLPDYYITADELNKLGWNWGDRPSKFAPGKTLTAGIYQNSNGRLPQTPGRVWYEADINYTPGRRNRHRILWSNDGLVFVTYDHYNTFYEID